MSDTKRHNTVQALSVKQWNWNKRQGLIGQRYDCAMPYKPASSSIFSLLPSYIPSLPTLPPPSHHLSSVHEIQCRQSTHTWTQTSFVKHASLVADQPCARYHPSTHRTLGKKKWPYHPQISPVSLCFQAKPKLQDILFFRDDQSINAPAYPCPRPSQH